MSGFKKAVKVKLNGRVALCGVSGSGKTMTALKIARGMSPNGRIAVIDSERGSASKYADIFDFDVMELDSFHPNTYIKAINEARGYDVLLIDSLSHAWMGKDGALEQVDRVAARTQTKNSFTAWREVTPLHNALVEAILAFPGHVIVTMRSKSEYVMETNEKGKSMPVKVGLAPIQRDGIEFEFDLVADMNLDNTMVVTKTRDPQFRQAVVSTPTEQVGVDFAAWLNSGAEKPEVAPSVAAEVYEPVQKTVTEADMTTARAWRAKVNKKGSECKTKEDIDTAIAGFEKLLGTYFDGPTYHKQDETFRSLLMTHAQRVEEQGPEAVKAWLTLLDTVQQGKDLAGFVTAFTTSDWLKNTECEDALSAKATELGFESLDAAIEALVRKV